jgi:hypothetical protein
MSREKKKTLKSAALWLVGLHFAAVVLHSVAHEILKVKATPAQLAFIVPVIIAGPVVAGLLLLKSERAGAALLCATMLGSFVFGLYYHFVADTIDHVAHVARMEPAFWSWMFRATAWALLVTEAAGAVVGGLALARRPEAFAGYAARTDF